MENFLLTFAHVAACLTIGMTVIGAIISARS